MADIWNLKALCRCCHKDGYFRSMQYPYVGKDEIEVYSSWLEEVFGISMEKPSTAASIMICEDCIASLRDGRKFKKQVTDCELRFQQYCRNEVKLEPGENSQPALRKVKDKKNELKRESDNDEHGNTSDLNEDHLDNVDHLDNSGSGSDSDSEPLIVQKEKNKKGNKNDSSVTSGRVAKPKTIKAKVPSNTTKKGRVSTLSIKKIVNKKSSNKPKTEKGKDKGEIYYRCNKCGIYHKTWKELRQHTATQHKEPEIGCQFCEETIMGLYKYKLHVNKCHPGMGVVCKYCPEIHPQGYLLKRHVQKCHMSSDKIIFICDYCQTEFLDKGIMRVHILRVHMKQKTYACSLCHLKVNDKRNLTSHIEQVHENIRKFQCESCPKTYKTAMALKNHTRITHTFERPYVCECGEAFVTQGNLNKHTYKRHHPNKVNFKKVKKEDGTTEKVPLGGRVFRCFICKEAFPSRSAYRKHLNKEHKGMMPHQCHICARSYASTYALNRHILSHETTRKIKCNLCLKTFKHEIFLSAHMKRTHGNLNRDGTPRISKDQYVKCDICHHMVADIDKHKALHFKRPFKCHLCERDYSMNNALQRHIRETHMGVSHSCNHCEKQYSKPRSVLRHKQKHHPTEFEIEQQQIKTEDDE